MQKLVGQAPLMLAVGLLAGLMAATVIAGLLLMSIMRLVLG